MAGNCMVLVCSRATKMTKVTFKQGQLDKARKQPDPRQKAPELQKAIQSCSRDILKMVRFPAFPGPVHLPAQSAICICSIM